MQNAEQCVTYASWNEWRARDYLDEYYAEVMADERFALSFLRESLEQLPAVPLALDYGCGPTVHHAMSLMPKAREVYLADYLQENLDEVGRWLSGDTSAHDWSTFTRHIIQLEGVENPSDSDIEGRHRLTRERVTSLLRSDAGDRDPLGPEMRGHFPLVTTHYCAEGATDSKETWRRYMRNIASLVAPGGAFIVSACGAADYYTVGDKHFPCAGVDAHDMLSSLQVNGFAEIDLRVRCVPDHSDQGYSSVIFARAIKR